ncbi:MAG: arginine--tRNA ligase [Negativicutes bacterium]|nr:arginine--tRNA ligase [Negativicutes bacterium]
MNLTLLREFTATALHNGLNTEVQPEEIAWDSAPNPAFGDLSTPVCLKLAKTLRRKPLDIAHALAAALKPLLPPEIGEVSVTPPGYLNLRYDYNYLAQKLLDAAVKAKTGEPAASSKGKIVIEHTNINPNKAAHIGHLRNSCLGDTLARLLRADGYQVEVQNYIDDTGTAVADIVVGMEVLNRQWDETKESFDYFCWDLYTDINELYLTRPELKERQREILHAIESGGNAIAAGAKEIAARIVNCHLRTMARFDIFYDLLTWESDILHLGFWQHAFAHLQGNGGLVHETSGPNAGCWVVKLDDVEGFRNLENPDKVLVRSNGTATYVAKDIANQMWKFGILGLDFLYRPYLVQQNGQVLVTSDTYHGSSSSLYGHADRVINVIDIRQKYLQDVLRVSLHKLGFVKEAENSIHFGYEVVALSAAAAGELGVNVEAGAEKDVYAMAGRKGIGVKADDLVDRVIAKATEEVARRHPEQSEQENRRLGQQIAVAAIRYYMIRYNMNSIIVFDFAEALNMQGNTGPYLQYAHARANNILERARGQGAEPSYTIPAGFSLSEPEKQLIKWMNELPDAIAKAAEELAPSAMTEYVYQLASSFMAFYETTPVMNAGSAEIRGFRLGLVDAYRRILKRSLGLLGIPAPTRM